MSSDFFFPELAVIDWLGRCFVFRGDREPYNSGVTLTETNHEPNDDLNKDETPELRWAQTAAKTDDRREIPIILTIFCQNRPRNWRKSRTSRGFGIEQEGAQFVTDFGDQFAEKKKTQGGNRNSVKRRFCYSVRWTYANHPPFFFFTECVCAVTGVWIWLVYVMVGEEYDECKILWWCPWVWLFPVRVSEKDEVFVFL